MRDPEWTIVAALTALAFLTLGFLAATERPEPVDPPFCECNGDAECAEKCGGTGDPALAEVDR